MSDITLPCFVDPGDTLYVYQSFGGIFVSVTEGTEVATVGLSMASVKALIKFLIEEGVPNV